MKTTKITYLTSKIEKDKTKENSTIYPVGEYVVKQLLAYIANVTEKVTNLIEGILQYLAKVFQALNHTISLLEIYPES